MIGRARLCAFRVRQTIYLALRGPERMVTMTRTCCGIDKPVQRTKVIEARTGPWLLPAMSGGSIQHDKE